MYNNLGGYMKLIERKQYLDELISVKGTPDIKVITGVRRCGKSKLMELYTKYLLKNDKKSNIIHINFNISSFDSLLDSESLYKYISSKYIKNKNNIVLIDEIQLCKDFEKAIIWLYTEEKYDIYITGSNAFLLSSDLATMFTGRTYRIEVYPFSFKEYCQYYKTNDIQNTFDLYVLDGGMSGSYLYKNEIQKKNYLKDVYDTLVLKDIIKKYKIRNKDLIARLSDYMMDNISNITSARSLARSISTTDIKATNVTITSYIKYLCNAYAFYKVRKYDIKGKKYLTSYDKYYLCDHSFRKVYLGKKNVDYGRVYENIVALELIRRGYDLYTGSLYGKEIDFVAIKDGIKTYIQVSDDITNSKTFEREIKPLLLINDAYPKILLSRTKHAITQYEGIEIIDIPEWLLSDE